MAEVLSCPPLIKVLFGELGAGKWLATMRRHISCLMMRNDESNVGVIEDIAADSQVDLSPAWYNVNWSTAIMSSMEVMIDISAGT